MIRSECTYNASFIFFILNKFLLLLFTKLQKKGAKSIFNFSMVAILSKKSQNYFRGSDQNDIYTDYIPVFTFHFRRPGVEKSWSPALHLFWTTFFDRRELLNSHYTEAENFFLFISICQQHNKKKQNLNYCAFSN